MAIDPRIRSYILRGALVVFATVFIWAGWTGFRVWRAWSNVERVEFETGEARVGLEAADNPYRFGTETLPPPPETDEPDGPIVPGPVVRAGEIGDQPVDDIVEVEGLQTFLVIGSDQREETFKSRRADVILLVMIPGGSDDPIMVSIPRDLYVTNPCTGWRSRVNANLNGCGDIATGPEQLAVAVEDFTGVPVDHFAVFTFDGFEQIVERVGGVEICVENPVRDLRVKPVALELPAGCNIAGPEQALSWVRSRKTQELVDGRWRTMDGVSDLERNARQQDLLVQALRRLKGFNDIGEFSGLVEDLADAFAIDEGLSLGKAISTAWDLRSIDPDSIVRLKIPVKNFVNDRGEFVLLPDSSFADVLTESYPAALEWLASGA